MANVDDSRNLEQIVNGEKERLQETDIPETDREAILQFVGYREGRVARSTLKQDMNNLRRAAEENHRESLLELNSPSDVDRIIAGFESVGSATTKNSYNRSLRQFYKWLHDEPNYGEYDWIDGVKDYSTNNGNSGRLKAGDYLGHEEVTALIEAATHEREKALIEFLADTGARITVACNLRRKDLNMDGNRPTFEPNPNAQDGYKGIEIKKYPIHYSERPINLWLNKYHPDEHEEAPVFPVKVGYDRDDRQNMATHPQTAHNALKKLAEKAGIDRDRVHPHAFRHAAVRRMKTDPDFDFDWETVKMRTAWSDRAFEEMKQLYGALEESEQLNYFFSRAGRETGEEDTGTPEFRECPTCGEMNRHAADYCQQCGRDLEAGAEKQMESDIANALVNLDGDTRQAMMTMLEQVEESPEVQSKAKENYTDTDE